MKALRIIEVVNVRWFNATAWYGLNLARLLKEAGHELRVVGLGGTESFAVAEALGLAPQPLPLNSANPVLAGRALCGAAALLREFRPDVVNCHRGEGLIFWGLLKRAGHSFALVRTRGDQRAPKGNWPNRYLHGRLCDAVIATNSRTARQCVELLGLAPERVRLIAGGVDTGRFFPDPEAGAALRARLGYARDDLLLGLLGRFDAVKGQREFLEAVSALRGREGLPPKGFRARIRVLLLGFATSLTRGAVEGWVRDCGLEDVALISGRVDDVPAYVNALDLGVIASQGSEAIARAALEIMACGVPLVGTDVGVMPDLLSARALAPAGDGAALAALLERAASDGDFRASLREEQQKTLENLTERRFLEQTLAVYEEALARAGKRGG